MAREDTPLDQETFDRVLAEELGKGTDRRVAEGRARAAAKAGARLVPGARSCAGAITSSSRPRELRCRETCLAFVLDPEGVDP